MMDENTITLFDDFISGNLPDVEHEAFAVRLENETDLQEAFLMFTNLTVHLDNEYSKERADVKHSIANVDRNFKMESATIKKELKVRRLTFIRYAIAACVALIFGMMLLMEWSAPSYENYAFEGEISLMERSGDDTAFAKAETAFNTANYEEAIFAFDNILVRGPNAEISYYKGIALTELNRYAEGEAVFQELVDGNSVFVYKATFYKALSFLKQNKTLEAVGMLELIPEEAEVYEKARELLSKLD